MKPFTDALKSKIAMYRKNKVDISGLIVDVDLKGQDLSDCIICKLDRNDCDLRGCDFSHSHIGDEHASMVSVQMNNCNLSGCNFNGTKFLSTTFMHNCNAQNCNFKEADVSKVDYRGSDFTGCQFCDAVIKISTRGGIGCKFPPSLFEELTKGWRNLEIKVSEKKE